MPTPVEIEGRMSEYDHNLRRWCYQDTGEVVPEKVEAKHFSTSKNPRKAGLVKAPKAPEAPESPEGA